LNGHIQSILPKNAIIHAVGFSRWKKRHVKIFFPNNSIVFLKNSRQLPASQSFNILTWGVKIPTNHFPKGSKVFRLEDGFIRSVGLGAELTPPLSWVIDNEGIYYDATTPSRLETILSQSEFPESLTSRAAHLKSEIIHSGITKYNLSHGRWIKPETALRKILVPGQVETDASLAKGGAHIKTNLQLLQSVRNKNPDAWVIYKPHPDVVAGLRKKGKTEKYFEEYCSQMVINAPMNILLEGVDEVHTMTSLTGFEALLRGVKVVTYGMPFYAGWGLTQDLFLSSEVQARRRRTLTLEELVAGTLILYPTYVSKENTLFITPEQALKELKIWRDCQQNGFSLIQKIRRFLLGFLKY
jgi:capsular polysaccharide export protein